MQTQADGSGEKSDGHMSYWDDVEASHGEPNHFLALDRLLGPATCVNQKGRGRYYERVPE